MHNIIIIEMLETEFINKKKINRLKKYINDNTIIYVFSDRDKSKLKNLFEIDLNEEKIINVLKSDLARSRFKHDDIAVKKSENIISEFSKKINKKEAYIVKSLLGNLYTLIKDSRNASVYLNEILSDDSNVILLGKKNSEELFNSIFPRQLIKYYTNISYWVSVICKTKHLNLTIIKTDSLLKRILYNYIQPFILNLGVTLLDPFYILYNNRKDSNRVVCIRSKNHLKLLDNIYSKHEKLKFSYIMPKSIMHELDENIEVQKYKIKNSLFSIFRVFDIKLKKQIKEISQKYSLNWIYIYATVIINYAVFNQICEKYKSIGITEYYNFEESNFYGALNSYAAIESKLKSITIQHGYTVGYDYTIPLLSDERWVWGKVFKDNYIKLGEREDKIINICDKIFDIDPVKVLTEANKIIFLIAPEQMGIYDNPYAWVNEILQVIYEKYREKDIELYISIHPKYKHYDEFSKKILLNYSEMKIKVLRGINQEILGKCHIVFTGNTSVGFEAILQGARCIFYNDNNYAIYEYLNHNYIISIYKISELYKNIEECIKERIETVELKRNDFINNYVR